MNGPTELQPLNKFAGAVLTCYGTASVVAALVAGICFLDPDIIAAALVVSLLALPAIVAHALCSMRAQWRARADFGYITAAAVSLLIAAAIGAANRELAGRWALVLAMPTIAAVIAGYVACMLHALPNDRTPKNANEWIDQWTNNAE